MLAEIVKGNVLANADIVLQLDADRGDLLNLFVYDRLRQPVFRNAIAQHTAHLGHGVHNRHVVALAGQVISRCQATGTAADDANFFARGRFDLRLIAASRADAVRCKIFQIRDGDRLLDILSAASRLTRMGTNPSDGGGHGDLLLDDPHRLPVIA